MQNITSRVALNNEDLRLVHVRRAAVRQLARQRGLDERRLAAHELPCALGGLRRLYRSNKKN